MHLALQHCMLTKQTQIRVYPDIIFFSSHGQFFQSGHSYCGPGTKRIVFQSPCPVTDASTTWQKGNMSLTNGEGNVGGDS